MKTVNTTIEILGKQYPVRCVDSELAALKEAGEYLNKKMSEVQESGKAINLERIAIMTALNMAHQFLQMDQQKSSVMSNIQQRIINLQQKIEATLYGNTQVELLAE